MLKHIPGTCPTMRHIRREHSTLNMFTGKVSPVEKVTWATEPCGVPLFGNDRLRGNCIGCHEGLEVPGSRLAESCTLEEAKQGYSETQKIDAPTEGRRLVIQPANSRHRR